MMVTSFSPASSTTHTTSLDWQAGTDLQQQKDQEEAGLTLASKLEAEAVV